MCYLKHENCGIWIWGFKVLSGFGARFNKILLGCGRIFAGFGKAWQDLAGFGKILASFVKILSGFGKIFVGFGTTWQDFGSIC